MYLGRECDKPEEESHEDEGAAYVYDGLTQVIEPQHLWLGCGVRVKLRLGFVKLGWDG